MAETDDRSLQMLATALEKEERGRDFYLKAASTCVNQLGIEIFRVLAAEEVIHITRVKQIYQSIKGGKPWTDDWKAHKMESQNLQQLFRERISKFGPKVTTQTGDLEALEIGLGFEQGAIDFYEKELAVCANAVERGFLERMILEERSHYASLSDVKQYLTNPASWFAEKEHPVLDGA